MTKKSLRKKQRRKRKKLEAAQSDFFSVKVVGNIHENPELLEEK